MSLSRNGKNVFAGQPVLHVVRTSAPNSVSVYGDLAHRKLTDIKIIMLEFCKG